MAETARRVARIARPPLLLAPFALALALALGGCGSGSGDGSTEASPATSASTTATAAPGAPGSPGVIFEDDFDGDGPLDPAVWRAVVDVRHEASLTASPANARREHGNLVIEARAEPSQGAAFTSALVQTREAFRFGRFEARMKLPTGPGTWPAFWLLGRPTWPDAGEIDVMEHYARHATDGTPRYGFVESNLHSSPATDKPDDTSRGRVTRTRIDPTIWHTFAVEWEPDEIRFFVDGHQTASHTPPTPDTDGAWPFDDHREVIAFDLFLGAWAGDVKAEAMPQRLVVDWVKVTELPGAPRP